MIAAFEVAQGNRNDAMKALVESEEFHIGLCGQRKGKFQDESRNPHRPGPLTIHDGGDINPHGSHTHTVYFIGV
jgi:hypothetical protein